MKKFTLALTIITVISLTLTLLATQLPFFSSLNWWVLPLTTLYFAVIDAMEFGLMYKNAAKSPRVSINLFMGMSVGVQFIHLAYVITGILLNKLVAKSFTIGFLILYIIYTIFIVFSLIRLPRCSKRQ